MIFENFQKWGLEKALHSKGEESVLSNFPHFFNSQFFYFPENHAYGSSIYW